MESDRVVVDLQFPAGGLNRRFSYQAQPPLTTPDALNVWPDSAQEGRQRGGSRPGLGKSSETNLGDGVYGLDTVTWIEDQQVKTRLLAVGGGVIYKEDSVDGALSSVGGALNPDKIIMSAVRDQVVYYADHADDQASSSSTYQPKKYDLTTGVISNWEATDGTMVYGCPIVCLWRDRLVLAGGTTDAHGIFLTRQSDPLDLDYSEEDEGAAVNLGTSAAGQVADIVTAATPHSDQCLIVGCPTSLWLLRSDPGAGGWLEGMSRKVGIVDRFAHCSTNNGLFVFLSADGLYAVPASCSDARFPEPISRPKLPEEMLNVDRSTTQVSMAYDVRHRGIYIFLTPLTAGTESATHFWFDWESKSFWPIQFASPAFEPLVVHDRTNYVGDHSGVILGCRDGYLRRLRMDLVKDDGLAYDSHVLLGPLGDPSMQRDTIITELSGSLDEESGDLFVELQSGRTPQGAYLATPMPVGRLRQSRSGVKYPRRRGQSHYVRLAGAKDGKAWAWDSGWAAMTHVGRTR